MAIRERLSSDFRYLAVEAAMNKQESAEQYTNDVTTEQPDWASRLEYCKRRIKAGEHARAELYCREAIARIAELEAQLRSVTKERDEAVETLYRLNRNEELREGFAEWRKRQ